MPPRSVLTHMQLGISRAESDNVCHIQRTTDQLESHSRKSAKVVKQPAVQ